MQRQQQPFKKQQIIIIKAASKITSHSQLAQMKQFLPICLLALHADIAKRRPR